MNSGAAYPIVLCWCSLPQLSGFADILRDFCTQSSVRTLVWHKLEGPSRTSSVGTEFLLAGVMSALDNAVLDVSPNTRGKRVRQQAETKLNEFVRNNIVLEYAKDAPYATDEQAPSPTQRPYLMLEHLLGALSSIGM